VEEYGKENGYDLILGTTTSGNILYGTEKKDITEQVLNALNNAYEKGF
jgi:outer membrane protein